MGKIKKPITQKEFILVADLYEDRGLSIREIADETNIPARRIYQIAARLGLHRNNLRVTSRLRNAKQLNALATGLCPGLRGLACGRLLRDEPVMSERGHSTGYFDMVCTVHHRFFLQPSDWEKIIKIRKERYETKTEKQGTKGDL